MWDEFKTNTLSKFKTKQKLTLASSFLSTLETGKLKLLIELGSSAFALSESDALHYTWGVICHLDAATPVKSPNK